MNYSYIVLFFAVYSFVGWIIEIIYRSWTQKRLVNPGFLFGPFVPVYGFGALLIVVMHDNMAGFNLAVQFGIYVMVLSAIEYLTGELFERSFGLKLWDYSEDRFNINGKICLSFSLGWGLLAMVLDYGIHPFVSKYVNMLGKGDAVILSAFLLAYFITDLSASIVSLNRFRAELRSLLEKYITMSSSEVNRILDSFKRILAAFPDLNREISENLGINIKQKVNAAMGKMTDIVESVMTERRPDDREYNAIVKDILENEEFRKLENFFHHNSSILEHAKVVSYISYRTCKYLNLDYVSAARGGLLHDFFLYDWRNHDEPDLHRDRYHGLEHPRIALENSMKHFTLNDMEKDIIVKHMWPLTIKPPHFQESFVVTFVDKYVSSREFIDEFRKRREKQKKARQPV